MSFTQGTGKPQVSQVLTKRFEDLQAAVRSSGSNLESSGLSKWFQLYSDGTKILDGLDNQGFLTAFKRNDLNAWYVETVQPTKEIRSYRDGQLFKVQIDMLAGAERELRMRYRSRVRMLAHGVAKLQSQGLPEGPIKNGIMNYVTLLADRK